MCVRGSGPVRTPVRISASAGPQGRTTRPARILLTVTTPTANAGGSRSAHGTLVQRLDLAVPTGAGMQIYASPGSRFLTLRETVERLHVSVDTVRRRIGCPGVACRWQSLLPVRGRMGFTSRVEPMEASPPFARSRPGSFRS